MKTNSIIYDSEKCVLCGYSGFVTLDYAISESESAGLMPATWAEDERRKGRLKVFTSMHQALKELKPKYLIVK